MTERVSFPSKIAGTASGALALPAGAAKAPAVLLIQEWWGLNQQILGIAERWAGEAGVIALAIDLYRGVVTEDAAQAQDLMTKLDRARALADIGAGIDFLRGHPRSTGKVGITGYCMGGAYTFAAATTFPGISAAVPFYGLPPVADWTKLEAPVQAHFAARDDWAKPELAQAIKEKVTALGKTMELHLYEADHAFCNDRRPEVYDAEAAALAWSRAVGFMKQHLGQPT
jgi:carboxymethylenebutenolidase